MKRFPSIPERGKEKSLTVPDQALSIPEILKRYASGQSLPELNDGYFDEEIPDLKSMSALERMDLKRETAESITKMRDDLSSAQKMAELQKQKQEASASKKQEEPKTEEKKVESVAKDKTSE